MIDKHVLKNKAYRYLKLYDDTGLINHLYTAKTEIEKIIHKMESNKAMDDIINLTENLVKGDKARRYVKIKLCHKYSDKTIHQIAVYTKIPITTCYNWIKQIDENFEYWVELVEKHYLRLKKLS